MSIDKGSIKKLPKMNNLKMLPVLHSPILEKDIFTNFKPGKYLVSVKSPSSTQVCNVDL